jgi:hypothetical protein
MKDFVEQQIIEAVKELLKTKANELLSKMEFQIPLIDSCERISSSVVVPVISLSSCERTEKERIILLDAYFMSITFNLNETPESELHCYAYSIAVSKAIYENPSLNGVVDRIVITGKKYIPPKKPHCGESWELIISMRITIENPLPCVFSI